MVLYNEDEESGAFVRLLEPRLTRLGEEEEAIFKKKLKTTEKKWCTSHRNGAFQRS